MNNQYGDDQDEEKVFGFEVPRSPDSSYNNAYPGSEDDARDPPVVPPHLHRSLLSYPLSLNASGSTPLPENVILNHIYIENREAPRSVVALGFTHRFRSNSIMDTRKRGSRKAGFNVNGGIKNSRPALLVANLVRAAISNNMFLEVTMQWPR
ncbi:SNF1-related protein kinase regulatory subunit beta-3-like [Hibiscus syriacus]|uniref:SNF1-related protein kinase regulatory subunit beta-3-like n=1 Tax=Hibiscus syriacus TaxID=106335 RepID=UPI0019247FBC|nr:SNF1-related protein kinase regulatory subunit beta-3-like [Hibiscus syriacus]